MNEMKSARFFMLAIAGIGCAAFVFAGMEGANFNLDSQLDANSSIDARPNEPIYRFRLSSDETVYFGCSRMPGFYVRDVESGDELDRFDYNSQVPAALDVGNGDRLVLVAYRNRDVVAWRGEDQQLTPQRIGTLSHSPVSCCLSADGRFVAIGCANGSVEVIELAGGRRVSQFAMGSSTVRCVRFTKDGQHLLASNDAGRVGLYNAATGKLARDYVGHTKSVTTLSWSEDGRRFVSGGHDGATMLWDIERSSPIWTVRIPEAHVTVSALSRNGETIAIAGGDSGSVFLCDVAKRSIVETGWGKLSSVNHVRFSRNSPSGLFYVTMSSTSAVHRVETDLLVNGEE